MSRTGAIVSGFLLLQISAAPAFAEQRSLLVGTWAIDVTKLAMPDPPKSVAMMLAYGGGGKYGMLACTCSQVDRAIRRALGGQEMVQLAR